MSLVNIRNTSGHEQVALVDGRQHVLAPGAERLIEERVAQEFVAQNPLVEIIKVEIGETSSYAAAQGDDLWIANFTGDPSEPDEVTVWIRDKQAHMDVPKQFPNPKKTPRFVTETLDRGMKEVRAGDGGIDALNLGQEHITIPPYSVKRLPKHIASWMLTRDGNSERHNTGKIGHGRPKPTYWPDAQWDFQDVRDFLEMHAPNADLGPTAAEYKKLEDVEKDNAKELLLRKLFFVFARPGRNLFNREQFNDFLKNKYKKSSAKKEDLEKLLDK